MMRCGKPVRSYKNFISISLSFPGVEAYLKNLSAVAGTTHFTLGTDELRISEENIVIFGAWHPVYKNIIDQIPNKKGILWTSSGGEMDFTPNSVEILYLNNILKMLDDKVIDFILFTDPYLAQIFKRDKTWHISCPVEIPLFHRNVKKIEGISLLQPAKTTKNIYNNLLAVKTVQNTIDLKLHTNLKPYEQVIEELGIDYEMYNWLPKDEYMNLISQMRINLACFWCGEYFNYQVVEAALVGTQSVVSKSVDYYPVLSSKVVNLDNPIEISEVVEKVHNNSYRNIRLIMEVQCERWNNDVARILFEVDAAVNHPHPR